VPCTCESAGHLKEKNEMSNTTYADILYPSTKGKALLYDAVLVIGGSWLVALGAQISILLPSSPAPITGQTLAVLLVGALLGSRRGALSLLAYLGEGIAGLPVFAGGMVGLPYLLGPTGGYLVGFVAAAFITGLLAESGWNRHMETAFLAMLMGNIVIYVFGLPWLGCFVGAEKVLSAGLYPFILGDLLKAASSAMLLPGGWRLIGR